jgi:cell division protein FtsW (lipid II flippase)
VTYTTRRDRERRDTAAGPGFRRDQLTVLAVGVISAMLIVVCYFGRMRAVQAAELQHADNVAVDLSRVPGADRLEDAMAQAFSNPADRRVAARELFQSLSTDETRIAPSHVGALARITVSAAAIDGNRNLDVYAARLRDARARAAAAKLDPPASIPLFTISDITAIKPSLAVRSPDAYRRGVFWCAFIMLISFQAVSLVWRLRGVGGDRLLLSAAHVLTTLGFLVMLSRPDPIRDTLLVVRFTQGVVLGLAVCLVCSLIQMRTAIFVRFSYLSLAAAIVLSLAVIVFGSGPGSSGAKVNLGPVQPIEAIRLLIAFFLAGYLGRRWEIVRQVRATEVRGRQVPGWLNLPRLDHMLPVLGGVGISLLLFFVLRDLGPALLLALMFLAMVAIARARLGMVLAGLGVLVAGFSAGYWLGISKTLTARVAMWLSPWQNAVRGGDQIAQAAWAMSTGGAGGTGLGLGDARYLPAGHTDLVLAAIGEELGALGVLTAAAACAVIAWRGLRAARNASNDTGVFLAIAMALSIVAPMFVMAAGILGVIPLTGVVTPFVSYGGSAMLVNFAALGLLVAIGADGAAPAKRDMTPFHVPMRWLGGALAAAGVVLVVMWARVQVVSADTYLIKPQLSVQADGGLRYQYNPRVLDAAKQLPRGTVFDRRDVPVAADPAVVKSAAREYSRMQQSIRDACPDDDGRCYPFGGPMFHVLGDSNTRVNWSASNTSYVERDEEDGLRGFDDRAATVKTFDDDGPGTVALRRDYRDLIPLVRHRWEPDHPDVRAVLTRSRDVRLTLDARLQMQVAEITARAMTSAGLKHAAVVVLDADTAEVLASVSYPWPELGMTTVAEAPDAMLDRARYGLYPPGSTFKLVTAAAALRADPSLTQAPFTCSKLPGDRVGAKLPGYGRPIRDDVLERHAHGTLTMHDGMVHSCNAYFAQLAVRVGAPALSKTAALAGISYANTASADALRENLPYAGYGQGQVLTTPLRMARVAAAIGSGGLLHESTLVLNAPRAEPTPFLSESAARTLGGYMRDVVTSGTGQLLRKHAVAIAGKTGTAEVEGAKSHAWFVGFAPAGSATKRIAFAVILENAGYGGASAAAVAGQVVSAAASLGLVK